MLYRLAAAAIVAFWLIMMVLLVRLETHPEQTDIMDVPVSYVARIMFKHAQHSLLAVRDSNDNVGTVSIYPSITGSNSRELDFTGTVSMQMSLASRSRIHFNGGLNMDVALRILDFHVDLAMPFSRLGLKGDTARNTLTYTRRRGTQLIDSQVLPMDPAKLGPILMQKLGMDASALPLVAGSIPPPEVSARETQIKLHGESLEVYQVSIRDGTASLADFYVTRLGEVVLVTTGFGYTLSSEDF